MSFDELTSFDAECRLALRTLDAIPEDAWDRPALGQWNVAQLVAHLARATTRVPEYLAQPVDEAPVVDRVEYFRFDGAAEAAGVAQRAIAEAEGATPADLVRRFAEGHAATIAAAEEHGPARVLATFRGPMRLDEYLATRVLEVVVHHMDLRAALERPPESDPAAARATMHILEGLLRDPRPRNLGRTRFIQVATGRIATDDPRFPVLR